MYCSTSNKRERVLSQFPVQYREESEKSEKEQTCIASERRFFWTRLEVIVNLHETLSQ